MGTVTRLTDLKARIRLAKKAAAADEEKVNRAQRQVAQFRKEAGAAGEEKPDILRDIELRVKKECNREALTQISRIAGRVNLVVPPLSK